MSDQEWQSCKVCGAAGYELCPDCQVVRSAKLVCPPIFLKTDRAKLHTKAQSLLEYPYGPMGLIIFGNSGTQKTRTAWMIANRWIASGKRIACFDSLSFAHMVDRQFGNGDGPEWIEDVCGHDAVFFDDIDKCKLTEKVQTEMFGIVDKFVSNEKPLIVTSNTSGPAFEQRFSPNIGPALRRRLREFCKLVEFP